MRIIGLSAHYHDSAAALLEDGVPRAAVQEERFSRIKHDPGFPHQALRYCLEQASGPIDAFVYYEKPLLKFERILRTAFAVAPGGFRAFTAAMPIWLRHKLWIPLEIENTLRSAGIDARGKIHFARHHESHAASAFFPSPFKRAAILTLDGVGEWTTTALGRGEGADLEILRELHFPHSLGLLYSAFTYFCGFRVNSGEYKLMGLAPFGRPRFKQAILEHLVDLRDDGSFRLNTAYFDFLRGERMTNDRFAKLFGGPPRVSEAALTERECDLASSVQSVTEDVILRIAHTLHQLTGEQNLCLAGGVALNCVANARLLREGPFKRLWVQPAAGDAGGALGAACALYHLYFQRPRTISDAADSMSGALLGPEYSEAEISRELAALGIPAEALDSGILNRRVAEQLAEGAVVGLFQGRAEFGPRALGNRSILADARDPHMQRKLNLKIKFRESFRPFAPVVLADRAHEYFDLPAPSPYMLFTAPVRSKWRRTLVDDDRPLSEHFDAPRSTIPAVTHVDDSARVQTVDPHSHPAFHRLLQAFSELTGCPLLVNTSFNVRGEPPVCHPRDALECFLRTEMDCLALGPFFVHKQSLPQGARRALSASRPFTSD